jgi:hypothetical protein
MTNWPHSRCRLVTCDSRSARLRVNMTVHAHAVVVGFVWTRAMVRQTGCGLPENAPGVQAGIRRAPPSIEWRCATGLWPSFCSNLDATGSSVDRSIALSRLMRLAIARPRRLILSLWRLEGRQAAPHDELLAQLSEV